MDAFVASLALAAQAAGVSAVAEARHVTGRVTLEIVVRPCGGGEPAAALDALLRAITAGQGVALAQAPQPPRGASGPSALVEALIGARAAEGHMALHYQESPNSADVAWHLAPDHTKRQILDAELVAYFGSRSR